jgi:hypothetical protein
MDNGTTRQPHISTLQIIGPLVGNVFFNAILPGFEKEVSGVQKR